MSDQPPPTPVRRRDFLKVLGAGGVAAATVGCQTDKIEKLIPYVVSPDNTVPGVSNYYVTTCRECATGCGVVAEVRDGRAIKLEGNPDHPLNRGALCAQGQAALQGLYNPDRFRTPMVRQGNVLVATTWDRALQLFSQKLGEAKSTGRASQAVFINEHESGSFPAFLDQWLAGFGMPPHLSYDALGETATIEANRQSYGVAWPGIAFREAKLVVSFGADFLDGWGAAVPYQLEWSDARAKLEGAPRLVYVGPRRTLTGLNADEWIGCRPGGELAIAQALLGMLGRGGVSLSQAAERSGVPVAQLERLASEMRRAKPSLLLAGTRGIDATDVALVINQINQAAGNVGTTIRPGEALTSFDRQATHADLLDATARMRAGQVSLLMVRQANPVYALPTAIGFPEAFAKVPFKVSFSSYPDETTSLCDLVLPDNHALESWGDAEPRRGLLSLQQPTMDRVFDTRATADVLITVAKGDPTMASRYAFADYRAWLMGRFPGGAAGFTKALQKGVVAGASLSSTAVHRPAQAKPAPSLETTTGDYFLVVYPSATLGDGRGANKPWLQELPDPVTKVLWQSWVEVHPQTAKKLGVAKGDLLKVTTAAGTLTLPAYPYLGIRPDTLAIALGQGHTAYGRYAAAVGVNAFTLLPGALDARSGQLALVSTKARVTAAGGSVPVVTTEGSARQHGRGIAQAIPVASLRSPGALGAAGERSDKGSENAGAVNPQGAPGGQSGGAETDTPREEKIPGDVEHAFLPGLRSPVAADAQGELGAPTSADSGTHKGMYDPKHWSGAAKRRWAMTVDLARCTGCSACVTACYSENNIPTVGALHQTAHATGFGTGLPTMPGANILRSREMSWIRLERYFEGGESDAFDPSFEARFVPMMCQHCGNAPCEPVCPVYATYHSPDGLNVQVYNRCVGTRYCSNNCPYKVRYFNWFGYGDPERPQYAFPEPLNWQLNPDVTVRNKGVMEKCTFCVQRIRGAEHRARLEGRELKPDEFTVACAQGCPSRALVFGDAADPTWSVTKLIDDRRAYHVFEELNTFTAVVYLKKVNHSAPAAPAPA
ncbi:MAG: TAT-variant-translocated molybdopterin oxidoreductase [Gemmatimonadaceae bacterium]